MKLQHLSARRLVLPGICALVPITFAVFAAVFLWSPRAAAVAPVSVPDRSTGTAAVEPEPVRKVVQIQEGDTLSSVLSSVGVSQSEIPGILTAIKGSFDPRGLRAGEEITFNFDPKVPFYLLSLDIPVDSLRDLAVTRTENQGFTAAIAARKMTTRETGTTVTIRKSLYGDGLDAGIPGAVLMDLIDQYSFDIDFQHDIHQGDTMSVLWQQYVDDRGDLVKQGNLLMARLSLQGETRTIYGFTGSDGHIEYYDGEGKGVRRTLLRTPVHGAVITSPFGWRANPFSGFSDFHMGIDFGVPMGTPILAAGDGTVQSMSYDAVYGNHVVLKHLNGYSTLYAHMEAFARGLRAGTRVYQGDVIGYVGSTGESTGPHVHYEVRVWGKPVNPATLSFPPNKFLSGPELTVFLSYSKKLDADLARLASWG